MMRNPGEFHPNLQSAVERADLLIQEAALSKALQIIEQLEAEVATMPIASRFSATKKMKESEYNLGGFRPMRSDYLEMTEAEFKRQQLLHDLRARKEKIIAEVGSLRDVIMDMEATKTEG